MLKKILFGLLVFVPVTIIAELLHAAPSILFLCSTLAIIPLAYYIGKSTEELAGHTNPAVGGLLNATFGNATELIICLFALKEGLVEVVKASITGSIIGNLLLVLGLAIFCGGWKREKQSFNRTAASASGTLLLIAVAALVIPDVFVGTSQTLDPIILEKLSIWVSVLMILGYAGILLFALRTHKHLFTAEGNHQASWTVLKSVIILLATTVGVAWMSEILVGSLKPIMTTYHLTALFVGVIFVAVIGNAAEHSSAVTMAVKDKMELALQIAIGSAVQIAMFVAPALVLSSLLFPGTMMTLEFNWFELAMIVIAVLLANHITQDGESNWLEGLGLLAVYVIMGVAFYYHP